MSQSIIIEMRKRTLLVTINRPERRNAVDQATSRALHEAFAEFDRDAKCSVAILTGAGGTFCAGADLIAIADGERRQLNPEGDYAPMGPTRLQLSKPVIAAIEGPAVAGGLELAIWCDLRVASKSAVLGIYNRRFGVPLVDMGTFRLPRLIGQSRAMDMMLTGRAVGAEEAYAIGLVNRLVDTGGAVNAALLLADELCGFPQTALRNDRLSMLEQWGMNAEEAMRNELERGMAVIDSGETLAGAALFSSGAGRHGDNI
jgi:enoyl-CoA hydratase